MPAEGRGPGLSVHTTGWERVKLVTTWQAWITRLVRATLDINLSPPSRTSFGNPQLSDNQLFEKDEMSQFERLSSFDQIFTSCDAHGAHKHDNEATSSPRNTGTFFDFFFTFIYTNASPLDVASKTMPTIYTCIRRNIPPRNSRRHCRDRGYHGMQVIASSHRWDKNLYLIGRMRDIGLADSSYLTDLYMNAGFN